MNAEQPQTNYLVRIVGLRPVFSNFADSAPEGLTMKGMYETVDRVLFIEATDAKKVEIFCTEVMACLLKQGWIEVDVQRAHVVEPKKLPAIVCWKEIVTYPLDPFEWLR